MSNIIYTRYFSMIEVIKEETDAYNPFSSDVTTFENLMSIGKVNSSLDYTNSNIEKCWEMLYRKYYRELVFKKIFTDYEEYQNYKLDTTSVDKFGFTCFEILCQNLNDIFEETFDYYNALLTGYQNVADTLFSEIKQNTTNTSKYSDTPQDQMIDLSSDTFLTNISQYTSESNVPYTPIQRLTEVQQAYKSVMADWVKEFRKIFLEQQGDEEDD